MLFARQQTGRPSTGLQMLTLKGHAGDQSLQGCPDCVVTWNQSTSIHPSGP